VLTHWKEREPVYIARRKRIAQANGGHVPAYATAAGGAATEVEIRDDARRRRRLTQPDSPEAGVSASEFQAMVRDLHADAPVATAEPEADPEPAPEADPARDLSPDEVVMPGQPKPKKPKKPNRRHGRSR
jgi:SecD/SecF fusion protein